MNFREENVPSFSKICNLSDDGARGGQIEEFNCLTLQTSGDR